MASSTNLKLAVSRLDGTGEPVVVLAGMVEGRQWERMNGSSVGKAIEETPMVIVDLAWLAYKRRHGADLTLDEFEATFDVDMVVEEGDAPANPSDPATAPLTE